MRRSFIRSLLILFVLFVISTACEEDAPLKLTGAQREQLDTLFSSRVQTLKLEMDSLCDVLYEQELDRAVDSILQVRREQEAILRKKYQKQ